MALSSFTNFVKNKKLENKIKLVASLVEQKKFPLKLYAKWYEEVGVFIPNKKFNALLNENWWDTAKEYGWEAIKGAGAGAMGGVGGALAGATIGAGLHGAGKYLSGEYSKWKNEKYKNDSKYISQQWMTTKKEAEEILLKLKQITDNLKRLGVDVGTDEDPQDVEKFSNLLNQFLNHMQNSAFMGKIIPNQPQTNQPQTNQPQTNQPQTNQPQTNQPQDEIQENIENEIVESINNNKYLSSLINWFRIESNAKIVQDNLNNITLNIDNLQEILIYAIYNYGKSIDNSKNPNYQEITKDLVDTFLIKLDSEIEGKIENEQPPVLIDGITPEDIINLINMIMLAELFTGNINNINNINKEELYNQVITSLQKTQP